MGLIPQIFFSLFAVFYIEMYARVRVNGCARVSVADISLIQTDLIHPFIPQMYLPQMTMVLNSNKEYMNSHYLWKQIITRWCMQHIYAMYTLSYPYVFIIRVFQYLGLLLAAIKLLFMLFDLLS